jgi:hypothetical protein
MIAFQGGHLEFQTKVGREAIEKTIASAGESN